ncbi:hypothetical protein RUM44_000824 [Polyplax serrata]|uniref:beta-N-acetylhexosaminidase n=1 Tax=Polyplax serrata TaxID=468196 RepID=A0ABR1B8P9_POLSC
MMIDVFHKFKDNFQSGPNEFYSLEFENEFSNERYRQESFNGEKLVHLDLKGAPPKISYLLKFLTLVKDLGATGILIEYEDMFPYQGELEEISAHNAYTLENIAQFLRTAESYNMTVIPLVQTYGHMEFVMKSEKFQDLREIPDIPEVICPSHELTHTILQEMIDQVMAVHKNAKYFHMGCDEVYSLGKCARCQSKIKQLKWQKKNLYFHHVRQVADYIVQKYPSVRPIIWADEVIKKNENFIIQHGIPEVLDIMLWNYKTPKYSFPSNADMKSYIKLFKSVWIASAFKGAKNVNQMVPDPLYHLKNNEGWMHVVMQWMDHINFKGIVLTGWQRFNHFTVLCELLPVGIPSLAISLQFLKNLNDMNYDTVRHVLECNDYVPVNQAETKNTDFMNRLKCDFPGFDVYSSVLLFSKTLLEMEYELDFFKAVHFSFFNTAYNYTHPKEVKGHYIKLMYYNYELKNKEMKLRSSLTQVYDEHTVAEWILTNVFPHQIRLGAVTKIIKSMVGKKSWPRRPLNQSEEYWRTFFSNVCGPNEHVGCNFIYFKAYDGR